MLKKLIIWLLCLGWAQSTTAQIRFADTVAVHKQIIKQLIADKSKTEYIVVRKTNPALLDEYDTKSTSVRHLSADTSRVWNRSDWVSFISSIEKGNGLEYEIRKLPKKWFKQTPERVESATRIQLSPIFFSQDGSKVLCLVKTSGPSGSGSTMAYYMEQSAGKWQIAGAGLLVISD